MVLKLEVVYDYESDSRTCNGEVTFYNDGSIDISLNSSWICMPVEDVKKMYEAMKTVFEKEEECFQK
jgi:hypothetical protein